MAATWKTSIKRFLKRALIFAVVSLWVHIRSDIQKGSTEFKDKFTRNFMFFGYFNEDIKALLEDPSLIVLILLILEAIFNFLAIFGNSFSLLMSTLFFGFYTFLYFNPLLPEYRLSLYETRTELFLNLGTLLALMLATFYPYGMEDDVKKEVTDIDIPMDDLRIENVSSEKKTKKAKKY
jgi:hypothetical protein